MRIKSLAAAAAVALLGLASPSWASTITHSFEVVINLPNSPDNGTYSGTFSYDSSSITPGFTNAHVDLLTDLDFDFLPKVNSALTNYDETEANTGYLSFDAAGNLTSVLFGTDCTTTIASCTVNSNNWAFTWGSNGDNVRGFLYASINGATSVSAAVPEPGTLALLGLGLAGLGLSRRRRAN